MRRLVAHVPTESIEYRPYDSPPDMPTHAECHTVQTVTWEFHGHGLLNMVSLGNSLDRSLYISLSEAHRS